MSIESNPYRLDLWIERAAPIVKALQNIRPDDRNDLERERIRIFECASIVMKAMKASQWGNSDLFGFPPNQQDRLFRVILQEDSSGHPEDHRRILIIRAPDHEVAIDMALATLEGTTLHTCVELPKNEAIMIVR